MVRADTASAIKQSGDHRQAGDVQHQYAANPRQLAGRPADERERARRQQDAQLGRPDARERHAGTRRRRRSPGTLPPRPAGRRRGRPGRRAASCSPTWRCRPSASRRRRRRARGPRSSRSAAAPAARTRATVPSRLSPNQLMARPAPTPTSAIGNSRANANDVEAMAVPTRASVVRWSLWMLSGSRRASQTSVRRSTWASTPSLIRT